MNTFKDLRFAVEKFNPEKAKRNTIKIWELARGMDAPSCRKAALAAVEILQQAGIKDAHIEEIPSDGRKTVNGWIMPVEWALQEARLESVGLAGAPQVYADYAANPQNIAQFSPSTPGGKWVEGEVLVAKKSSALKSSFQGKFLLLEAGHGSMAFTAEAARKGALGVITVYSGPLLDAARYLNYSVPQEAGGRPCIPVFSLTATAGQTLREQLKGNPCLRLRAKVKAVRKAGTMPLVTGTIGSGTPEVYVCGHIDEIGAQDNASGCGVAIEALRVLQTLQKLKEGRPGQRAIRFFFSVEVRGIQGWLAQQKQVPGFLGGITIDMVGAKCGPQGGRMHVGTGFPHQPHFAAYLIRDAAALADQVVGGMNSVLSASGINDGMTHPGGLVGLTQEACPHYHTSDDTPQTLHLPSLHWSGVAAVAFLYWMTRLNGRDVLGLARRIHASALVGNGELTATIAVALQRVQAELASLPQLNLESDVEARLSIPELHARKKSEKIIPLALESGFLGFEDHVTPGQVKALKEKTGLGIQWGTSDWAWILVSSMKGRQTLTQIVDALRGLGVSVDYGPALRLTRYLATTGRVQLQGKHYIRKTTDSGYRPGSLHPSERRREYYDYRDCRRF